MEEQQNLESSTFLNPSIITTQPTPSTTATTIIDGEEIILTLTPITATTPTAPVYGIQSQDFMELLKNGDYSDAFTLDNNNKRITHDPTKMRFFTKTKDLHGIPFPTAESCDIICHSVQDLRNLKDSLLSKHFMFKGKMFVVQAECNGIQSRIHRSCVFTVNPKHPDIAERLITAFEKAERYAEQGFKYQLLLNFDLAAAKWFQNFALTYLTPVVQVPGTRAFATLSITNGSTGVQWCGEFSQPRFFSMAFTLPCWCFCCCAEKTYRKCAYKTVEEVMDCDITTL